MYICMCMYVCVYLCVYMCMYVCMYMYIYIFNCYNKHYKNASKILQIHKNPS